MSDNQQQKTPLLTGNVIIIFHVFLIISIIAICILIFQTGSSKYDYRYQLFVKSNYRADISDVYVFDAKTGQLYLRCLDTFSFIPDGNEICKDWDLGTIKQPTYSLKNIIFEKTPHEYLENLAKAINKPINKNTKKDN